jgi:uncharacterized protein
MLVRFAVQNYLSFNERTEFNMLTGSPRRLPHHVYHRNDLELLKMAAVYGANGAGKSNFVQALATLQQLVISGTIDLVNNNRKFKLSVNNNLPIIFELEFISGNQMYFYYLEIENNKIINEKLLTTSSNGAEELVFERKLKGDNDINIQFNEKYRKSYEDEIRIKLYEKEILGHKETLLAKLSESRDSFSVIKQAYSWFYEFKAVFPNFSVSNLFFVNDLIFQFAKEYIKFFNTGISDFEIKTDSFDDFFGINDAELKEKLKIELSNQQFIDLSGGNPKSKIVAMLENGKHIVKRLITYHNNVKGEKVIFDPTEESDGSVRILDILLALFFSINRPNLVLIDEIERSIHPNLIKELITKFSEHKETKGQLIFTTHESNLLDQEIFRQDEIWFAEKNTEGATEMYPMSDFDVRYDLDVRKGYLNGRFGAIPFLSDFKNLNWKAHVE